MTTTYHRPAAPFQRTLMATFCAGMCAALCTIAPAAWSQTLPAAGQFGQPTAPTGVNPITQSPAPVPAAAGLAASVVNVAVSSFSFVGNTAIPTKELNALVQDAVGKQLDLAGLDQVANRISRFYRSKGYTVARAFLPPQQSTDGAIRIDIIEGRYAQINLKNTSQIDTDRLTKTIAANLCADTSGCKDELVQDKGLERAILIVKDLPGTMATANIKPGAALGTSDVDLTVSTIKSQAYSVGIDNYGSTATGKTRLNAGIDLFNLANSGDALNIGLATTSQKGANTGSIGYSLPAGYSGARVGLAYARSQYRLGTVYSETNTHGTSNSLSLYGNYPVVRAVNQSLYVRGALETRKMYDSIDLTNTHFNKSANVLRAGFNGDNIDAIGGGGYTVYGATYSLGRMATNDLADLTGARVGGGFSKLAYNIGRQQAVSGPITLYAAINGQFAGSRNLDGSEQIGIGGPGAVRGYAGEAGGSQGIVGSLELRHTQPFKFDEQSKPINLTSAIFVDRGWVNAYKDTTYVAAYKRALGGYGVSLTAQSTNLYVRAVYAGHSAAQPSVVTPNSNTNFWLQAGLNY